MDARRMVETQIRSRGVSDPAVLRAMERVPRHRFVPAEQLAEAYADTPLPIGRDQTISQPYVVALIVVLGIVTYVPDVVMLLPRTIGFAKG